MDNESAEVIHPKFKIWVRPDGIVQIRWAHAAVMNYEDAIAATDAMNKLTGGKRCPLLVDAQDAGPQDRAARSEFVRRGGRSRIGRRCTRRHSAQPDGWQFLHCREQTDGANETVQR
jgi:hypothetical protein